jgi:hypothetical protein
VDLDLAILPRFTGLYEIGEAIDKLLELRTQMLIDYLSLLIEYIICPGHHHSPAKSRASAQRA